VDAALFQGSEKRFLLLRMFEKNGKVVSHIRQT